MVLKPCRIISIIEKTCHWEIVAHIVYLVITFLFHLNIIASFSQILLIKVKATIAEQYPIAGQSHEFFSKLEIYESLNAILVYRIQTSKRTL